MSTASDALAAACSAVTEAVRAACADPADAVRLLAELAAYTATPPASSAAAPIGAAMATVTAATAALCRRAALGSLALACADCQLSAYEDAVALLVQVTALIDAEITVAGDAGQDGTFVALRALRAAVVQDLTTRAADLPHLVLITSAEPMPAPALAQRLYQDGSRAADLVARADPVHPAFLPTSFEGLAT